MMAIIESPSQSQAKPRRNSPSTKHRQRRGRRRRLSAADTSSGENEAVINSRTRGSGSISRRGLYGWNYCVAGIVLSIAVTVLLNGPQSVSAGFACLSNPCVFGVCVDDLNSTYSCYCIDGYTGSQCQTNWDECWSSPCQNGAVCIDGVAHYNCSCPDGFAGINCEENLDECASNPCQNGGICNDKDNSYVCSCQPGYLGQHCETDVAVCDSAGNGERCQNGGSCVEGSGLEFTCQCPSGWQGQRCEEERNECESSPCQNGAVCVDKLDSYSCACPMKFTGANCEEPVLECDDSPCHNDALCLMEEALPVCYCVPDFHGEHCEDQYDECQLGPRCMNGGTCIDGVDDFTCSCPAGLTGILCECLILDPEEEVATDDSGSTRWPNLNCNYTRNELYWTTTTEQPQMDLTSHPTIAPTTLETEGNYQTTTAIEGLDVGTTTTTTKLPVTTDNGQEAATTITKALPTATTAQNCVHPTSSMTTDATMTPMVSTTTINSPPLTITTSDLETTTWPGGQDQHQPHLLTTITMPLSTWSTSDETPGVGDIGSESDKFTTILFPAEQTSSTVTSLDPVTMEESLSGTTTERGDGETTATVAAEEKTKPTITESVVIIAQTTIATKIDLDTTTTSSGGSDGEETTPQTGYPHSELFTASPTTARATTMTTERTTATEQTTPPSFDGTLTNFTMGLDCNRMPCLNGGTCFMTSTGAQCLCSYNRQGMFCEKTIQIRRAAFAGDSYVSHRVNAKPRWQDRGEEGEPPVLRGDKDELERALPMDVVFRGRTRANEGLIMLAIGQGTHGSHYMALFLQRGLLQFQFSCGLQTMLLSELEAPINTGHEMIIHASLDFSRNFSHCNASLKVNDSLALSGDQSTWLGKVMSTAASSAGGDRPIILNTWLHLGGAPQAPIGLISELPGASTGFTGCLHSLRINGRKRDLFGDAVDGYGISECGSLACLSNPCRNGARCLEVKPGAEEQSNGLTGNRSGRRNRDRLSLGEGPRQTTKWNYGLISKTGSGTVADDGDDADYLMMGQEEAQEDIRNWQCKCPTGYIGPTCEISVCDNNPCQYGGTCIPYPGSGYLCLCPFGKHGHYCEHNLEITQTTFSGSVFGMSSYVSYPVTIPLDYEMDLSFRIVPSTLNQIALLAFVGQTGYHDDKADHLAVSFVKGYVMLTWNVGGGPRRIFTPKPLQEGGGSNNEHVIRVQRVGRQAWLSVDNGRVNVTGRAPGSQSKMEVAPVLYLGGHEVGNFSTLPHDLPLHSGFEGCIYDLQMNTGHVAVPLTTSKGVHGRGVGQCNTRECHRHACQHDGACLQHGATFTCICQEGWYGPLCAHSSNPCDADNNQCHPESTCVPLVTSYECDCPVGKAGKSCDNEIKSLSDVSLTGRRSYLAIDWPTAPTAAAAAATKRRDGSGDTDGLFENEIPSDKYRMMSAPVAHHSDTSTVHLKFVNELGQPVVGLPFYGQPHQPPQRRANYESVADHALTPTLTDATRTSRHQRVQFYSIEFQLRPLSERGLLVFFGAFDNELDEALGFVSLSLQGGVVEFRVGARKEHVTVLRSNRILAIGEWHKVRFSQSGRRLSLWVEGSAVSATTEYNGLSIRRGSRVFFGGLPDLSKLPLAAISGFPVPFRGCVRQVMLSGRRIVLNETNIRESRNIQDCDGTSCGGDLCDMGGHCWLDSHLQPHCKCPESARGERCELQESCYVVQCKNGGRCLKNGQCNCPNGFGGYYCEIAMSYSATPSFNGRSSYLKVAGTRLSAPGAKEKRHGAAAYSSGGGRQANDNLVVSMNFSTTDPNGLLLWASSPGEEKRPFLGLGLENGHLKLASSLLTNDSMVDIPTGGYLADGGWHNLYVFRSERDFEMRLDDREIFAEDNRIRDQFQRDISLDSEFYIGGFPDDQPIAERTLNRFHYPFRGCLQDVFVNSDLSAQTGTHLDLAKLEGQNIGICDLDDNFV